MSTVVGPRFALSSGDQTELLAMGTATLYEASRIECELDPVLRPAWSGARLCGAALPVLAAQGDNLPLHWALDQARPGDVLVVDAGGARYGYWGEVLSVAAQQRQVSGLVIDGGVRDTERLRELGFPAFSSSVTVRGTVKRWAGRIGEPVTIRGRTVTRGDLVVADQDGIVVIPVAEVERTVAAARERIAKEEAYMGRLRGGELTVDIYGLRTAKG